ncbi:Hsp70 family protein [Nakamurella deserti]|uniref:Hsp70 family protein n=1 Tax=Nakamurella deserti TaxID=2164074 RepID=UPI000DBE5AFE|nr:Hsp70 family protein [Nakamurella deserti]
MTAPHPPWTLAVDFGTSNTAAAYRLGSGPVQPVRLSDQAEQVPSAVLALDTGITVGGAAVRAARLDPQRFEPTPKRRIGEGEILLGPHEWPVTRLIAAVLAHVAQKARWMAGGAPPRQLVLTCPQQWAQGRRGLLVRAAAEAGFDPATVVLVTEPVAAATWYAATQPVPPGRCVAVFDFGGGTCDVAVLRAEPGRLGDFTVLAADGVDPLGGELLDVRLLTWTLEQLRAGGNGEMADALAAPENLGALITLKEQVRHAKHELSEYESARIPVAVGTRQAVVTITSAEFDRLVEADIDEAVALTRRTLVASGQTPADLHALYLTGGSSHLRSVHRKLTELLGRPPATFDDPKLVVAQGALLAPVAARSPQPGPPPPAVTGAATGPFAAPVRPVAGPPPPTAGPTPPGPTAPGPTAPVPQSVPSAAPDAAGSRRPRWLVPAIAAALVAVLAVVVVLVTRRGGDDPRVLSTGTTTVGGTTADVTTVSNTAAGTTGSPVVSTTTSAGPVQRCPNGTTVPADDTCPTDKPVNCWDASTAPSADLCPALEGQAALEWIFPAADGWTRSCTPYEKEKYVGELEVYECHVEELAQTTIFLSRWDAADTAKGQFTTNGGEPVDFRLEGDGDTGSALEWTQRVDVPNDDGTTSPVTERAVAYKSVPYSMLVYFNDPDGVGAQSEQAWMAGALFQSPESIDLRGAV